jgi:two-component system, cell cycle sensor histidine kinase and response regulator CckA
MHDKKNVAAIAVFMSAFIALGGYCYYSIESSSLHERNTRTITAIAELKINQIAAWHQSKADEVGVISQSPFFTQCVRRWLGDRSDKRCEDALTKGILLYKTAFDFHEVFIVSAAGEILLGAEPPAAHIDPATRAALRAAVGSGEVTESDFYRCSLRATDIHFEIIAPLRDEKGRIAGAIVFRADPRTYLFPLIQTWPMPSATSEALLVRRDGDSVVYLNDLRFMKNSALAFRKSLNEQAVPAVRAARGYTGVFEGRDYRNVEVLAYIAPIPGTQWFLVTQIDHREMFAELYYRGAITAIITIISILLLGAAFAFYYHSRQKDLYRDLFLKEKQLREYQDDFRTILYSIGDGVITTDVEGRIKQMNRTAVELTGWMESEAKGREFESILPFINKETRKPVANPIARVLREGVVVGLADHTLLISKDGKEIPVADSGAPIRNERGGVDGAVLVFRDVTKQNAIEDRLRKLSRSVEQSPASVVITDLTGKIEYVNPKFTEVTGYTFEEALDQNPRVLKSGKTSAEDYALLWQTILSGKVWHGEFQNRKKNGELFWESASISPITDETGQITHFVGLKEDITDRKRLEQQLIQAQKMEGVGTLAGGIAHDFNNLLAMILGSAELLRQYLGDMPSLGKYVDRIIDASERGKSISRQLLIFSRPDQAELKPISLSHIIGELRELLKHFLSKTIAITTEIDAGTGIVLGDGGQIHQALLNLALNAGDAMVNSGRLTIRERYVSSDVVTTRFPGADASGRYIAVSVSDTGAGMDEAVIAKIFDPFFSTKERGKGTGLGLAMVHGIVKNHKGFIDVESTLGQGTTFTLYFPELKQIPEDRREEHPASAQRSGGTILIVDDEEMLRDMLHEYLVEMGYRVHKASNGLTALEVFGAHRDEIDLVITDLGMPDMGGEELYRRMKKDLPSVRVIVSSGYLDGMTKDRLREIGILGILEKPYRLNAIQREIKKVLQTA